MANLTTFQISEIAKDTYVINEAGMSAMFVVKGSDRALLIDCGVGMTDLKAVVAMVTDLPYDVVITHGHLDHIGGAAQYEEVYIHKADADTLQAIPYDDLADYVENLGKMGAYDVYHCSPADIRRSDKVPKALDLHEGMTFDLGGRILEVIETPGHTPGSCSLIDKKERILFSGDACNVNTLCLGCSVNTLLKGLDNIKSREADFDRNFNGHVGYAGMPLVSSMPETVLDDAIHICETILDGTADIVEVDGLFGRKSMAVMYGAVRVCIDPQRLIDDGEAPAR